ncbi:MAG: hypothetical protein GY724_28710 [Actinomycetia bacterium]|nr:hypothetical protein [Actinomycetes bacterium]MCP5032902.1 hypothetical protein [Actinomycetes bacterium]
MPTWHSHQSARRGSHYVVVAALALFVVACGGRADVTDMAASSGEDGVASIGDTDDDRTAGKGDEAELEAPENPEDAFELFNQCMADAGVGIGGGVSISGSSSSAGAISVAPTEGGAPDGTDPQQHRLVEEFDMEEFEAANNACAGHLAKVDSYSDLSPEERTAFEDAQLEWAGCMQDHGIEVPDLEGGAASIAISSEPADMDPQSGQPSIGDTEFEAFGEAAEACRHHFDDLDRG